MISLNIPGYGDIDIEHFVTDYSGTLSEDGILLLGLKGKLNDLSEKLHIHVLTSDTFGKAREELNGVNCTLHVLEGTDHTGQKEKYILMLGSDRVVALGNGNNDIKMLKAARLGICVCLKEGCSIEALKVSQVFVKSPIDAIDLFLNSKRLIATLRK
jgi:soluble P-type ATPase